jgi:hypothetical protein
MNSLRIAFSKFDAILKAMQPQEEEENAAE